MPGKAFAGAGPEAIDITPFKDLLRTRCGFFFETIREAALRAGLNARMSERGMHSPVAYLSCLMADPDELGRLVDLLTVNETYFFREPGHLDLLVRRIIPEMTAGNGGVKPVRIISAGCSTGEEPYSILIALLEKYGQGILNRVCITGVDIDRAAIAKARSGIYPVHSFRTLNGRLKAAYFEPCGKNVFRIKDELKKAVEFRRFNLFSETYPQEFGGFDVIFYRNVSIYFESAVRKNIFTRLAGLLNPNGYLFLSSTETLCHDFGILALREQDGIFLYKKSAAIRVEEIKRCSADSPPFYFPPLSSRDVPSASCVPEEAGGEVPGAGRTEDKDLDEALCLAKAKKYAEALACMDRLIARNNCCAKGFMMKAGVLLHLKRPEEAEQMCLQGIAMDRWGLEGYLLLGMIAKMKDDQAGALKRFKEALYIQPSCWMAHFHMGDIHRFRGEPQKACREYEIVVKLLEKGNLTDHGLTFFSLAYPVEQIVHLCNHHLSKLRGEDRRYGT
ncbi:MAG: hypothetical protein C4519_12650 [Desulfobacteraceae bacterium]|nr:MAG: hypothetical protein C4519_12650 [Desulfobacteraceae bacterium]